MAKTATAAGPDVLATGLPDKPGKLPGAPPRSRRDGSKRKGRKLTREQASAMGKLGGRPAGAITKAYSTIYELAKRVMTDPIVQDTILFRAQMGTLDAATMRDLMYTYGGRPAYKMQVQRVTSGEADDEARRQALRAMDPERRRLYAELLRESQSAMLAIPERTEATDAEIVTAP